MPRCAFTKLKSRSTPLAFRRSTRPLRMARMRSRISASSVFPRRAQFRRGEHGRDHRAAVRRRVRVVRADHALQLRQHARGFFLACRDDRQRADALAVQRERLRERRRHEHVQFRRGEQTHGGGVRFDVVAEALIGDVEERHQLRALTTSTTCFHCSARQVHAGRVVAARVQHDDRAGRHSCSAPPAWRRSSRRAWRVVVRVRSRPRSRRLRTARGGFPSSGR